MTARFHSSGLPPSRITQGQSPPTRRGAGPSFLESPSSPPPQSSQSAHAERPRCALRSRGPHRQEFEAGLKGASRKRHERFPMQAVSHHRSPKESRPMNATEIAAALSTRAEDVCRRYLPRGRKQGRYWTSRRHKRRQGALALRAPGASRDTRKMDRICCGTLVMLRIRDWVHSHRRSTSSKQHNVSAFVLNELAQARASLLTDAMTDRLKADGRSTK